MCMESKDCNLKSRMESVEGRVSALEDTVKQMRSECQTGFAELTRSVNDLGHDFGSRMNTMECKLVDEKVAWGKWAREHLGKIILWACGLIAFACGVNNVPDIIKACQSFRI